MKTNVRIIYIVFCSFFLFCFHTVVYAENCDPTTSDDVTYILDGKACVFHGQVDGVDAGAEESELNNAVLVLTNNTTLTIPNNQVLAFGSMRIELGSMVIRSGNQKGSAMHVGRPLYYTDVIDGDNDKIPGSGGELFLIKNGKKRKGKNKPYTGSYDCNDSNKNIYQTRDVGTDSDHDGFIVEQSVSATCVGDAQTINARVYYDDLNKNAIKLAEIVGPNDCNDALYDPTNTCE